MIENLNYPEAENEIIKYFRNPLHAEHLTTLYYKIRDLLGMPARQRCEQCGSELVCPNCEGDL